MLACTFYGVTPILTGAITRESCDKSIAEPKSPARQSRRAVHPAGDNRSRGPGVSVSLPVASPSAVACGGGSAPYPVVLRRHSWGVASRRAARGIALVFQCHRPRAGDRRDLRVWRPRHHAMLSPATDASRPRLSEMAGIRFRGSGRVRHAGPGAGVCAMQDTPARWVAVHRRHHEHADQQEDPHSPLVGFFWGHVGWMLVENADLVRLNIYDRYSKDILRDRFYRRLERTYLYPTIIISLLGRLLCRRICGWHAERNRRGRGLAVRREFVDLGVFVRAVLVWHVTWLVNSASHLWGYRTYETDDKSRNNWGGPLS